MDRRPSAAESDNKRRVIDRVNAKIVARRIEDVTDHSRQRYLQGKLDVLGICESVCYKKRLLCARAHFLLGGFAKRSDQILERSLGFDQLQRPRIIGSLSGGLGSKGRRARFSPVSVKQDRTIDKFSLKVLSFFSEAVENHVVGRRKRVT